MSAAEALKAARAAGIHVEIDGNDLVLEAPTAPAPAILDQLSRHKVSIVAHLKSVTNGGAAADWRTLFEERARFAQHDRGLRRDLAEAEAFKACIATCLNKNPVTSPAGLCIVCGRSDHPNDVVLPYGTTPPGAAWLHATCWPTWLKGRHDQAAVTLAAMGIVHRGAVEPETINQR